MAARRTEGEIAAMSNRTYTKEQLDAALASMGVTDQTDVSRYGSGHINDTFKVETRRGVRFIASVNREKIPVVAVGK